jgi:hypothetical protein
MLFIDILLFIAGTGAKVEGSTHTHNGHLGLWCPLGRHGAKLKAKWVSAL